MRALTEYKKNGYDFRITTRVGNLAIATGRKDGCADANYEVIEIQSHNGREIAGKFFEPAEFPPSSEQWGTKGFTCLTLDDALAKLEILSKQ